MQTTTSGSLKPAGYALVGAPLIWLAGWIAMRLKGHTGPGWGWTLAHSLWVVAFVLFSTAILALYRLGDARTGGARATAVTGLVAAEIGVVALGGQMMIDLSVGFASTDQSAMDRAYDKVFDVPGVQALFYNVGPVLFFVGMLVLAVVASVRHKASISMAVLVFIGIVFSAVGKGAPGYWRVIEGLGIVCIWLAFAPVGRHLLAQAKPATEPATEPFAEALAVARHPAQADKSARTLATRA